MAINDRGDVVGFVGMTVTSTQIVCERFSGQRKGGFATAADIGRRFQRISRINNNGQIVGISCAEGGVACKPVLWLTVCRSISIRSQAANPGADHRAGHQ
jgi:hypothetical protein